MVNLILAGTFGHVYARRRKSPPRRWPAFITGAAAAGSLVVAVDVALPLVRLVAGVLLLLVLPTVLVRYKFNWPDATAPVERWLLSFGVTLLGLLVGGLLLTTVLPWLGVAHPLARVPVVVAADVAVVGLVLWRPWQVPGPDTLTRSLAAVRAQGRPGWLVPTAAVLVVGAVVGAIRLNNEAGSEVATAVLALNVALLVVLAVAAPRLQTLTLVAVIYLTGLSLLLMTSLRGWYVTGHDVQLEYHIFELTAVEQYWHPGLLRSAYNACLSITVLPTMLAQVTGVPPLYVFKAVLQVLFALCPVLVFLLARRVVSARLAVIATAYFVTFPTFFTDMPFLTRQEVAFVFLGLLLLAASSPGWSHRRRQAWSLVCGLGVLLAHYSTNYVFIAVMLGAWAIGGVLRLLLRVLPRLPLVRPASVTPVARAVLGPLVIVPLLAATVVWTGPVTHSGGQLEKTATSVVDTLVGGASGRSSDTRYSLFSGVAVTPAQRLADYRAETITTTTDQRADGELYPLSVVDRYPTSVASTSELAPTPLGAALERVGIDVSALNHAVRSVSARVLQIFIVLGLATVLVGRFRGRAFPRETFALALASFVVVLSQVVLPAVSVDFGVLRAFQQALFLLAPLVAVGSVVPFAWAGLRRASRVGVVLVAAFALSLTGVLPQILGGYPAQLQLNNAGQYYDIYYVHPEEVAAIAWLQRETSSGVAVPAAIVSDSYTSSRLQNFAAVDQTDNLFPTLVPQQGYVFLGTTTVRTGQVTLSYEGDVVAYDYPIAFLDETKDLIYASDGARIYR